MPTAHDEETRRSVFEMPDGTIAVTVPAAWTWNGEWYDAVGVDSGVVRLRGLGFNTGEYHPRCEVFARAVRAGEAVPRFAGEAVVGGWTHPSNSQVHGQLSVSVATEGEFRTFYFEVTLGEEMGGDVLTAHPERYFCDGDVGQLTLSASMFTPAVWETVYTRVDEVMPSATNG